MRTLNLGLVSGLAATLQSVSALGAAPSISSTTTLDSLGSSPASTAFEGTRGYQVFQQGLSLQNVNLGAGFGFNVSFTHTTPDYRNYTILRRGGVSQTLADLPEGQTGAEYSSAASLNWATGPHSASLAWSGHVSASPFASQRASLTLSEALEARTTVLALELAAGVSKQPDSAYIDSGFVTRDRPTLLHSSRVEARVTQALTERLKTEGAIYTGTRPEDRPRHWGLRLQQGYALTERHFLRLDLEHARELTNRPLLDEKGYFTLSSAELGATYEPWFDFLATLTYAYVVETEQDPRSERRSTLGSDQYGLGLKLTRRDWTFELKSAYRRTNLEASGFLLGGNISWSI